MDSIGVVPSYTVNTTLVRSSSLRDVTGIIAFQEDEEGISRGSYLLGVKFSRDMGPTTRFYYFGFRIASLLLALSRDTTLVEPGFSIASSIP